MMTARPGGLSKTTQVLAIASLVGTFVAMYFKALLRAPAAVAALSSTASSDRGAGTRVVPQRPFDAGAPDGAVHGQGARYVGAQQPVMEDDLWTLADRIARNREIAGLHYRSDTLAGVLIAQCIMPLLRLRQRRSARRPQRRKAGVAAMTAGRAEEPKTPKVPDWLVERPARALHGVSTHRSSGRSIRRNVDRGTARSSGCHPGRMPTRHMLARELWDRAFGKEVTLVPFVFDEVMLQSHRL